jgi:hypothetical protein
MAYSVNGRMSKQEFFEHFKDDINDVDLMSGDITLAGKLICDGILHDNRIDCMECPFEKDDKCKRGNDNGVPTNKMIINEYKKYTRIKGNIKAWQNLNLK